MEVCCIIIVTFLLSFFPKTKQNKRTHKNLLANTNVLLVLGNGAIPGQHHLNLQTLLFLPLHNPCQITVNAIKKKICSIQINILLTWSPSCKWDIVQNPTCESAAYNVD